MTAWRGRATGSNSAGDLPAVGATRSPNATTPTRFARSRRYPRTTTAATDPAYTSGSGPDATGGNCSRFRNGTDRSGRPTDTTMVSAPNTHTPTSDGHDVSIAPDSCGT